jgi:TetR/AcrR family transcriptional regulator, transcriptional repressor for nem operon
MPRVKNFDENAMVEKAKNLFHQKGYEATSMQDLVDTLGISRSSLYDTFGDKHQLYIKSLNNYCESNAYSLAKEAELTNNPLAFIESIFDITVEQSKKDMDKKGCYVVNAIIEFSDKDSDVKEVVDASNKVFEKMLEKLIIKGQELRQINKNKNPKQMARFLFNTIYGLRVSAKANVSQKELKDIVAMALSVLQ